MVNTPQQTAMSAATDAGVHGKENAVRPLSNKQTRALNAIVSLARQGVDVPTVRDIGPITGQSSDGAAYTLRSLVRRGLVELGHHDGNRYGYKLTPAGMDEMRQ